MSSRFKIKKLAPEARTVQERPWSLASRRNVWLTSSFATFADAVAAMDNLARKEAGLAPRIVWPRDEASA